MRLLSLKGCLDRIFSWARETSVLGFIWFQHVFYRRLHSIQAQNHGLVLVPMETLVLLDRAAAALKEEYRKNDPLWMVIFHATCRFSTMSLEFSHIYSIYTCRPNSKYSGNSLLKQGTFAYSRSIHNMTYLRTWWYNTRNSKTDLADPSQTSSLLCFKGRIETHGSSGICHLAILPFDRVAFSNSMAAALQDVFFLRRLERTRGGNMFFQLCQLKH